ncbi:LmbE family N-acetylglucosaminyl deacetylase [Deinococcus metalli]|uniref:LmbE family N-acetylglucosaminyl deacetylase n=1 Tax=Deinococcus metalli TaxID=1141878 RepID=A0A7W8KGQ0_9DEIO|nr:PIG-L deacetylase family protein [Deinococcus metalli]MBB5377595.1 LmbE family N-acetylglucosaminyl deacetylase [Deinococcus metalli]GHF51951.1 PIG-L domain-containing protein [Deinococcus metalli]
MTDTRLKLLLIVPHPDDEVYGASGTLMRHLEAGDACGLVTLTRGEAGRTLGLCDTPEELARLREVELGAALDVIGLTRPEAVHAGSVFEHHHFPDKSLRDQPFETLVDVAWRALSTYRPEILLTFPPNGSNGHPDHVTTHRLAKAAWDRLPEGERPRLWYYASDTPPENEELRALWLRPNTRHDVTPYITRKLQAIACHRSQALSTVDFIRKFPERITTETFHEVGLN